jgi:hypothetical protein
MAVADGLLSLVGLMGTAAVAGLSDVGNKLARQAATQAANPEMIESLSMSRREMRMFLKHPFG